MGELVRRRGAPGVVLRKLSQLNPQKCGPVRPSVGDLPSDVGALASDLV